MLGPDKPIPYAGGEGSVTDAGVLVNPNRLQGLQQLPGGAYLTNTGNVVDKGGRVIRYNWELRRPE